MHILYAFGLATVFAVGLVGCTTDQLAKAKENMTLVAQRACQELPTAELAAALAEAVVSQLPDGTDATKAKDVAARARQLVTHLKSACALVPPPVPGEGITVSQPVPAQ